MTNYALETENLTRRFGSFLAVDGISLRIAKGQLYGFLGLNGAGKTTAAADRRRGATLGA
jgi:ABC-type multidrug transport system ATPase subunit